MPRPDCAAVIVGVDRYTDPAMSPLRGAVADARAMNRLLIERFGFMHDRVVTLYDGEATAARIEGALRGLAAKVGPQGAAVFFFAGHGSQRFDDSGDEADGFDETLVPVDSGRGERPDRDITDDRIREHLEALCAVAGSVTAIFDCCHSGTAGREGEGVRRAPPGAGPRTRRPGLRAAAGELPYTLIAAAAADELSHERRIAPGGPLRGLLTRTLVDALGSCTAHDSMRSIMARVALAVRREEPGQTPQIEGAGRDRRPFSSERPAGYWAAAVAEDGGARVALGRLHGVRVGDVIPLAPSGGGPTGEMTVQSVGPLACQGPARGVGAAGALRAIPPPQRAGIWTLAADPAYADQFGLSLELDALLDDDGVARVLGGEAFTLRFVNAKGTRLYCGLLLLDPADRLTVVLPEPGVAFALAPFATHVETIEAAHPDGPGQSEWRLVLVASTHPFDLRPLAEPTRSPLVPPVADGLVSLYPLTVRIGARSPDPTRPLEAQP